MAATFNTENLAGLRKILINHFDMDEIKDLCFDLGIDFQLLSHKNKRELIRELLAYLNRRGTLSCLITEVISQRPAVTKGLEKILEKLPDCDSNILVFTLRLNADQIDNVAETKREIAHILGLSGYDINIVGASGGSIRLLLGLPQTVTDNPAYSKAISLGKITDDLMIYPFDTLNSTSKQAWRLIATKYPPKFFGNKLRPTIQWQEAIAEVTGAFRASNFNFSEDFTRTGNKEAGNFSINFEDIFGPSWKDLDNHPNDEKSRSQGTSSAREILDRNLIDLSTVEGYRGNQLKDLPDGNSGLVVNLVNNQVIFVYDLSGSKPIILNLFYKNAQGETSKVPNPEFYRNFSLPEIIKRLNHQFGSEGRQSGS